MHPTKQPGKRSSHPATGGTSSSITGYTLLTFPVGGSGMLTVSRSGIFDVLIVGGGATGTAGSRQTTFGSGGGGCGPVGSPAGSVVRFAI